MLFHTIVAFYAIVASPATPITDAPPPEPPPMLVHAYTPPEAPPPKPKPLKLPQNRVLGWDCVSTLKKAGLLPQGRVTKDGRAETIPVKPLQIREGEHAVIRTAEGPIGHVLQVTLEGGKYISTVEGGHSAGVGRTVDPDVIAGEVSL